MTDPPKRHEVHVGTATEVSVSLEIRWRDLRAALQPEGVTLEDFRALQSELAALKRQNASAEEAAQRIAARAPAFAQLPDVIRQHGLSLLIDTVAAIFTILAYLKAGGAPEVPPPNITNIEIHIEINEASSNEIQKAVDEALSKAEKGELPSSGP